VRSPKKRTAQSLFKRAKSTVQGRCKVLIDDRIQDKMLGALVNALIDALMDSWFGDWFDYTEKLAARQRPAF
jgi:hypothetical protein